MGVPIDKIERRVNEILENAEYLTGGNGSERFNYRDETVEKLEHAAAIINGKLIWLRNTKRR